MAGREPVAGAAPPARWLPAALLPVPWRFLALSAPTVAGVVAYAYLPEEPTLRAAAFVALQLALAVPSVAAFWLLRGQGVPLPWVLGIATLVRAAAVPSELIFENDVFRYLWDARVAASGGNPWAYAPAHEALAPLRDDWVWAQIPFRQVPTIYPPLAQAIFGASRAVFGESVAGLQVTMLAFELGTVLLLYVLGERLGARSAPAAYALHPLAIKELVQGAHVDAAAVFLLTLAVWLLLARRKLPAAAALAAAALVKMFPVFLVPALWRRSGLGAVAVFGAAFAAPFAALVAAGVSPFAGLEVFARFWIFNPSLYDVLVRVLDGWMAPEVAHNLARPVLGLCIALAVALHTWRMRPEDDRSTLRALVACLFWLLLLSPAANPWYVAWLLPLALLTSWRPALVWTWTASLSYGFYLYEQDLPWLRLAQYLPVFGLLVVECVRSVRAGRQAAMGTRGEAKGR